MIKIIERGWAGHFICANRCRFRRNTLIDAGEIKIVVSTVGLMEKLNGEGFEKVGCDRYFETMAFHAKKDDPRYYDIDVEKQIYFNSEWSINKTDADDKANEMHEKVIIEIKTEIENGNKYE